METRNNDLNISSSIEKFSSILIRGRSCKFGGKSFLPLTIANVWIQREYQKTVCSFLPVEEEREEIFLETMIWLRRPERRSVIKGKGGGATSHLARTLFDDTLFKSAPRLFAVSVCNM